MSAISNALFDLTRSVTRRFAPERRGTCCFSQEGEDMVLVRALSWKRSGIYVDVGAHHPMRFSNTYFFYLQGWRGLNIDAMPGSMQEFRRLRPRDINVEALVSSTPGPVKYYVFNDPAMNTCDPELARHRDGLLTCKLVDTKNLQSKTLAALLEQHLGAQSEIDFMTIDVEGLDLDVLKSNDWEKFNPRYILTEDCALSDVQSALASPTATFLAEHGYSLFAKTVNTLFFTRTPPN